ncbi:MAG: hypothetical protein P8X89_18065 [Reinekea sp.]
MKVSLINKVWRQRLKTRAPIFNVGANGEASQKRAMFSYVIDSFNSDNIEFSYFTNRKECQVILTCLVEMGFCVDVYDCREVYNNLGVRYDFIFGFGDPYRNGELKPGGSRVLYLTEAPPDFSFENEQKRIDYFMKRHRKKLKIERSGTYYAVSDTELADSIVCLGSKHAQLLRTSQKKEKVVLSLSPSGLPVKARKNIFQPSREVVWFGSRGIVHKGLDLLIDAFKHLPEWTLHVCGVERTDAEKIMKLPRNVFLSCSEAVPTSVLTCMRAGLIPIISPNCGESFPNVEEFGNVEIDALVERIKTTVNCTPEEIEMLSVSIYEYANSNFSLSNFKEKISDCLKALV